MHLVDSAPDGLVIDWEDGRSGPDITHDCCPVCDLELCLVDPHPKFGVCPCGLPRWSDHEGSPCCEERAAGNDNQGAA